MALTDFQQAFKDTLLKITDDKQSIYAEYLAADNDNQRQLIIDKINSGEFTHINDVSNYTKKLSPVWQMLNKEGKTK